MFLQNSHISLSKKFRMFPFVNNSVFTYNHFLSMHALIGFFLAYFLSLSASWISDDRDVKLIIGVSHFFIDDTELCDWLTEPFINQEFDEDISQNCLDFVSTDYNELSSENMEHRRKKQVKITTLVCEECGKNFSRLDSLRRHEKLYCKAKSKPTCCPICGKKFEKPFSLHNHINQAHALVVKKEEPE